MLGRIHSSSPFGAGQFFQILFHQRVQGRVLLFGNPSCAVGGLQIDF